MTQWEKCFLPSEQLGLELRENNLSCGCKEERKTELKSDGQFQMANGRMATFSLIQRRKSKADTYSTNRSFIPTATASNGVRLTFVDTSSLLLKNVVLS